ncbi:hypothetical protein P7C70_g7282, partial [Phenoliferia sp. Uapishka_3]
MFRALTLLGLVPLAVHAGLAGLAGNEDFAATRKLYKRASEVDKDPFASAVSVFSFDTDGKSFMSPIGETMKRYTLDITAGSFGANSFIPVTVFDPSASLSCGELRSTMETFKAADDVWDEKIFMKAVMLQTAGSKSIPTSIASCLAGWNVTALAISGGESYNFTGASETIATIYTESPIPQGPYIASIANSGSLAYLTPVYRVYRDEQQAFTSPSVADATGNSFLAITAQVPGMATQSIPVPSRLYTLNSSTTARPLEGMRVAVKDIYDLKGLRTGCGNRAYFNTYAPRNASAYAVQKLVNLGAIIVGKDKTSQFANGEGATADWVDQLSPFSAYEWLDFAIGSDSGGSIRDPAAWQGIYGLRPSHGAISLSGVMPLSSPLDTAGYFARDAFSFRSFGKAWYGDAFKTYSKMPKRIFVPDDYFPLDSTAPAGAQAIYAKFISELSSLLNAKVDTRSLATMWNASVSSSVEGMSMSDYMNTTYATLIGYYQYTNFGAPWISDYQEANGGRSPFLDPQPKVRWAFGRSQGESGYNTALAEKETMKEFVSDYVLTANNASCTESLFLYPIHDGDTAYRNLYFESPSPPFGFGVGYLSPMAETAEMVLPLGQVKYNSTIDNFEEVLPVAVAIIARKGCDYVLLDLAAALQNAGIISGVKTGRSAF